MKNYFLLFLLTIAGLFTSQNLQAQCPTLDPSVGTTDYGAGIEVCVQTGGAFATITFTFLNNGSDYENFLLYDIANSSFLIEGLSPVVYVHSTGSNVWEVQNVPDEFVAGINSNYIFAKLGCPTYGGTGIDINPNDEIRIEDPDISITNNTACIAPYNGAISITATGGYGAYVYSWTGPNGFTASTQNIAALEPGTYTIVITDDHNCSYSRDIDVADNAANPTVSFSGLNSTGAYCENDAIVVLTGDKAPNGSFSGPGIIDNGNGTANFDPSSAGVGGDITYTYTDPLGCTGDSTRTVTISPVPSTPTATNDGPVCESGDVQLSTPDIGGATYSWTGPNGFTSTLREPIITNITTAGAGTYSVTVTLLGCPSLAGTTDVVVDPIPTTPVATNDGPVCDGGDIQLSTPDVPGATYSWTGPNGFTSTQREPIISGITSTGAGTYSVTIDDGACPSLPGTTDVVVNPIPTTPVASNDGPACEGDDLQLSTPDVPGATYLWTGPNGFTSAAREPVVGGITASGAGTYSVTVTLLGCPSLPGTTDVTVNPIPSTPIASNSGPVCESGDVQLSTPDIAGATYAWTGPNGFNSTVREPIITGITIAQAGTYSVTITLLGCPSLAGTTDVIVNPILTTPVASNDGPVCEGSDLQLSTPAVAGATYIWTGPNGFNSTLREPIVVAITSAGGGTYSVVLDDGTCPSLPGTTDVVVNPIPTTPVASNDGPACEGDDLQLSTPDVVGATYAWTGPNGFTSTAREPLVSGITAAGAGTYSVTVTLLGCPSLPGATDVIVNPIPTTPVASNSGPVCESGDVQLSTPDVAGATFAWTGPNGFTSSIREPIITGISIAQAGTYSVTVTLLGCPSLAGTMDVIVNPIPATPVASNNGPVCEGGDLQLSTPAVAGATYLWMGPNGFTSTTRTPIISGITISDAGAYSVIVTLTGCPSLPGITDVIVNPIPTTPVATNDGPVCEGDDLQLSTADVPGASYAWTGPNGFTSSIREPIVSGIAAAGAGTYSVTVTLLGCPSLPGATDVIVNPIPTTPVASNSGPVCESGDVQLSTPDVAGATFAWTGPNGFTSSIREPIITGITIAQAGTYSVTITLSGCPSLAGTTDIIVNPIPTTPVASNDGPVCDGGDLQLSTPNVAGATYAWTGPNGFTSSIREPIITGITVTQAGTYSVTITLSGCPSLAGTTDVIVNPIPTTPLASNDGPVCEGGDLQLSTPDVLGASYAWTGLNGFTSTDREPLVVGIPAAGAGTYSVIVTLTGCPSLPGTTDVVVTPLSAAPTASNDGPVCEGGDLQLSTPDIAGATYAWTGPNGFTSIIREPIIAGVTVAGAGTYSVVVTDGTCPSLPGTTDAVINQKPPAVTISGDANPVCQASGIIYSVTGQANSTYVWTVPAGATITGPADGPAITVDFGMNGGNISVVETTAGATGCTGDLSTLNVTLQNCLFTADFTMDVNELCVGGSVLFTDASSAPIGTNYAWDFGDGATPATENTVGPHNVVYNTSGIKTITLTITNGPEISSQTKTITVNDLPTADLVGDATICPGSSAVLTVNLTGKAPWIFVYNDGTSDITENINSSPYQINVNPVASTTYIPVSVSDALCTGIVSGSATIDVTPAKDVTIRLDSISGVAGSQVKVPLRVVDFADLMTMQFTIAWDSNLLNYNSVSDINIGNVSNGNFGTAEINNGFLTFSWNTESLSDTTILDNTSIFSVVFDVVNTVCTDAVVSLDESPTAITPIEIADENLCIANVTVIGGNVEIQSSASISSNDPDNLICFGDQIIFTGFPGGMANYQFYLNGVQVQDGANSVYINNTLIDQDSVNVIVADAQGCTLPAQGIVTAVNQINVTPTITDISACGLSDGAIALAIAGGSGTYSFSWTGPSIIDPVLQDQSNLGRGFYTVAVTDGVSGCTEVLDIELKEPVNFTLTASKTDVTSTGGNDGAIDLTISGGTGTYDVLWTGPNGYTSTDQDINGLFAGTYIGTITDMGSGCTDATVVEILQPINNMVLNATKTDVTTCDAADGTINLLITGGSGSYGISWIGPNSFTSSDQNLSGLEGGLYIATVTDLVTTLSAQWTVEVNEPDGFVIDATVTDITYCDGADGTISLNVTGGSGDFNYLWKDLSGLGFTSTDKDIADLELGDYRVIVTDNVIGCIDSLDTAVGRPAICDDPCALNVESTTNNTSCPDTEDGVAVINIISGGSGPGNYYVSLDTGKTFVPFLGQDITSIIDKGQGSYLYIAKDTVTGCQDTTIANIGVSTNLMANIDVANPGCAENDGIITFNVSGGVVPFEVEIIDSLGNVTSKNGNGFFQFMDLTAGSYFYTVREQSGCTIVASDSIELRVDCESGCTTLIASAHSFEDATCASDPNGKAIIDVVGGSSPYEYTTDGENWIPFISGNVVEQLPPNGIYNIAVRQDTLNASCRAEVSVEIYGPEQIVLETPIITTQPASCNQNDGAVKIGRVAGGTGVYNYQIDGTFFELASDSIVANLGAGMHTFSVIDAVSCKEEFAFEVESPGVIVADISDVPVSCSSIFLKAGIRIEMDMNSTTLPGPYEAYVATTGDPNNGIVYQIPDNGIRTILNLDKDFYIVNIKSSFDAGCAYSETISVFSGAYPLEFDIIDSDSIVSCIDDIGSITIGNVKGDPDTTFIVQLINESNIVLETYEVNKFELEGGFTIDESNTDKLVAGKYYIKMIQNQGECLGVEATSELITIYEPLGQLGFEVTGDEVSLSDRPTGYITGEVIPSGGNPYEALIQLIDPEFEMNISDIIDFNESRAWEEVPSTGDNLNRYPVKFDSLWAGLYEIRVVDDYGCEYILEHSIGYDETVFVPNVFTPNNDGYNDSFYIRNLPESGTKVTISNRNGSIVFKSDDYNIDTLWDGGNQADGIYYYTISMPSGETFKGWVEKWAGSRP